MPQTTTDSFFEELLGALRQKSIDSYVLDTEARKLTINYKEDFDRIYLLFKDKPGATEAMMSDPLAYGAPYGAGHWATFSYRGWSITGHILRRKKAP